MTDNAPDKAPEIVAAAMPSPVANDFRRAMRRIASTVTVVTAVDGPNRHGMTATSMTSLSMDPPSLIVCLNQRTRLHEMMRSAETFCVNVLNSEQAALSHAFSGARQGEERFGIGNWSATAEGLPYLADAQTNIFCRKAIAVPYGTHIVLIGDVEAVTVREALTPLVYHDAAYASVLRAP